MTRVTIAMLLCMTDVGCADPSACQSDVEAEKTVVAYDTYFAAQPVTESQRLCVHDFSVRYQSHRKTDIACHESGLAGCEFDPNHSEAKLYVSRHGSTERELGVLRHELTHLVLFCVEGDSHPLHDVPEFNFHDGPTDEPGTLMYFARRTPVDYVCNP